MGVEKQRIELDRNTVLKVFSGELTRQNSPDLFDDDILLFCVSRLQREDRTWLFEQLKDPGYSLECRMVVASCVIFPDRDDVMALFTEEEHKEAGEKGYKVYG